MLRQLHILYITVIVIQLLDLAKAAPIKCQDVVKKPESVYTWSTPNFVDEDLQKSKFSAQHLLENIWPRPAFVEAVEFKLFQSVSDQGDLTEFSIDPGEVGLQCGIHSDTAEEDQPTVSCPDHTVWLWKQFCGEIVMLKRQNEKPSVELTVTIKLGPEEFSKPFGPPEVNMKEQYDIAMDLSPEISSGSAIIDALSVHAIPRALETLKQIILSFEHVEIRQGSGVRLTVLDEPHYPWRGMMVDTARHFLPVDYLVHVIRTMAANKLNVFHWHLTDAASFPLDLPSLPEMAKGAFDASKVYSVDDLKYVVEAASNYSIRVVPELDMPAHTRSWSVGGGDELVVDCSWQDDSNGDPERFLKFIDKVSLDVTQDRVIEVIEILLGDLTDIFPDKYFHLGFDEVHMECWQQNAAMMKRMKEMGVTDVKHLLQTFMYQVFIMLRNAYDRVPVVWQDVLDLVRFDGEAYGVQRSDLVVQGWKCWDSLGEDAVYRGMHRDGHHAIQSSCWYLDWDSDWRHLYGHAVSSEAANLRAQRDLNRLADSGQWEEPEKPGELLGGEAALWTERIDFTNADCRLWPRSASIAEKLWSDFTGLTPSSPVNDSEEVLQRRFLAWFKLLSRRGIQWEPLAADQPNADSSECIDHRAIESFCPLLTSQTVQKEVDVSLYPRFEEKIKSSFGAWVNDS